MMEAVIGLLLVFIAWESYQRRQERREFFEYIKAKDADELARLKAKPRKEKTSEKLDRPELDPIENVSQEVFDKAMIKELGRETTMDKAKDKLKKILNG